MAESWLVRFMAEEGDDHDTRLRKSVMLASSLLMASGGVVWTIFLWSLGEPSWIPPGYVALTILSVLIYRWRHNYLVFRTSQLLVTLLLPFLLALDLGGVRSSGAVVVWALLAPLGALLFCSRYEARGWMIGFAVVLVLSIMLDPVVRRDSNIPDTLLLIFFVMNIAAPSIVAFLIVQNFTAEKERAFGLLASEQERTERLLLNVLPAEIAPRLKDNADDIVAEEFEAASVLFSDMVGFTGLSTRLSPKEMALLLNEIFSVFDGFVEEEGIEKIRTIGDGYMIASGVPTPREDHAEAIARVALKMAAHIQDLEYEGEKLNFRIGIHSGPLVGAVVGTSKFHYDLLGDTVNLAARMEQHGVEGKIQISRATHDLLETKFELEHRGEIEIKGKEPQETWFLKGLPADG